MDQRRAETLLAEERRRLEALLLHSTDVGIVEREGANEQGDIADSAEPFTSEEENNAIAASLRFVWRPWSAPRVGSPRARTVCRCEAARPSPTNDSRRIPRPS